MLLQEPSDVGLDVHTNLRRLRRRRQLLGRRPLALRLSGLIAPRRLEVLEPVRLHIPVADELDPGVQFNRHFKVMPKPVPK